MAEGGGVEPPSGGFSQERRFSGPVSVAVASRPPFWSESRDSNPVRTVLQTAASSTSASLTWRTREESNLESQFWRLLPSPSGRVRGTPGRIRTCTLALVLSEPRLPDSATGASLVGRGRLELPCANASRSERGVSTRFHHRPVSRAGLEPARLRRSTACVCQIAPPGHTGARGRTRTYEAMQGNRVTAGQFCQLTHTRSKSNCQRTWRRAGDSNPDVRKATES